MPMTVWGPGRCGSKRMWGALQAISDKKKLDVPEIIEDGKVLSIEQVLVGAQEKWENCTSIPGTRQGGAQRKFGRIGWTR